MTSKNGSQELVSLLQYMKETRLDIAECERELLEQMKEELNRS